MTYTTPRPAGYPTAAPWTRADGSHSFGESRAADLLDMGHARIALNRNGEPARSMAGTLYTVPIVAAESLPNARVRLTLETGRTMTVGADRWMMCEYIAGADYRLD